MDTFSVVFNHGGEFISEDNKRIYRGGVQTVVSGLKIEQWNMLKIENLVKGWGMQKILLEFGLHYKVVSMMDNFLKWRMMIVHMRLQYMLVIRVVKCMWNIMYM
jgi:hypothetical protein